MIGELFQRLWGASKDTFHLQDRTVTQKETEQDTGPVDKFVPSESVDLSLYRPGVPMNRIFRSDTLMKDKGNDVLNDFVERYHNSRYNMVI